MPDPSDVHGGLLALTQLSQAFSGSPKLEVFRQEVRTCLVASPFDRNRVFLGVFVLG